MSDGDPSRGDRATGTIADVSHVHPDTRETFGQVYRRGPAVADGGALAERSERSTPADGEGVPDGGTDEGDGPAAVTDGEDADGENGDAANGDGTTGDTVADVDHEGPTPDANVVWSRGDEETGTDGDEDDSR